MQTAILSRRHPIYAVPGIGRRTAHVLYTSGVHTVAQFLDLPDFLLAQAFGPSLAAVRQSTQRQLERTEKPGAYALMQSFIGMFLM